MVIELRRCWPQAAYLLATNREHFCRSQGLLKAEWEYSQFHSNKTSVSLTEKTNDNPITNQTYLANQCTKKRTRDQIITFKSHV